jgi:hypothetical protein
MDNPLLIRQLYEHFNARNVDAILLCLSEQVEWANGMQGGYVYGHEAVRAYWTAQWRQINPHVEPIQFEQTEDGSVIVDVHLVVKDLEGNILLDEKLKHAFHIQDSLIQRFDIKSVSELSSISL